MLIRMMGYVVYCLLQTVTASAERHTQLLR